MIKYKFGKWFLIGGILFLLQCSKKETERDQTLRNVILTQVSALDSEEATTYPGVVEEGSNVSAAFMADGKIGKILVKEGDRVSKGQLLASLDASDYRIGVSQLETQLNQMTKEKERMDAMYEKHNIAPNDYEKFEAGYEQLKLQLDLARRNLDYTNLYSPIDGYIVTKYMSEGELVGAGTPVFKIIDDSNLKAVADLPVSVYLNRDKITSINGTVPGIPEKIPLSLLSFTPDADNNMLYRMKLSIPATVSKELTSGMNISVEIEMAENDVTESIVPSRSLFKIDDTTYVWVFNSKDSTINKKPVTVEGSPIGKMSKVKGLRNGEEIVETGVRQLYEGEKVNVLNRKDIGL